MEVDGCLVPSPPGSVFTRHQISHVVMELIESSFAGAGVFSWWTVTWKGVWGMSFVLSQNNVIKSSIVDGSPSFWPAWCRWGSISPHSGMLFMCKKALPVGCVLSFSSFVCCFWKYCWWHQKHRHGTVFIDQITVWVSDFYTLFVKVQTRA